MVSVRISVDCFYCSYCNEESNSVVYFFRKWPIFVTLKLKLYFLVYLCKFCLLLNEKDQLLKFCDTIYFIGMME